jgi:hypothetical protein
MHCMIFFLADIASTRWSNRRDFWMKATNLNTTGSLERSLKVATGLTKNTRRCWPGVWAHSISGICKCAPPTLLYTLLISPSRHVSSHQLSGRSRICACVHVNVGERQTKGVSLQSWKMGTSSAKREVIPRGEKILVGAVRVRDAGRGFRARSRVVCWTHFRGFSYSPYAQLW